MVYGIMADVVVVVNELLCFMTNYFGKAAKTNITTTVVGFYEEDELVAAKSAIYGFAEPYKSSDSFPRYRLRKTGDNKKRLDCEDIYAVLEFLDKQQVALPKYVALNLVRVPSIQPDETDIVKLAIAVSDMRQQLRDIQGTVCDLSKKTVVSCEVPVVEVQPRVSEESTEDPGVDVSTVPSTRQLFSNLPVFCTKNDDGEWSTVTAKKKRVEPPRRMVGADSNQPTRLKVVPAKSKAWHIFVGRLHPDTSDEDISGFLEETGINVVKCLPLKVTEEWQKRYAAFHVVVDFSDKDNIFDSVQWPAGVDVRDWVFKKQ